VCGFKDYSIPAEEETSNDTSLEFAVDANPHDEWDQQDLDEMIATKKPKQWRTGLLLNELCRRGLVPAGDYIVSISW